MCREGRADMALDLYMHARAEGIKPNQVICDSIIGMFHELDSGKQSTPESRLDVPRT